MNRGNYIYNANFSLRKYIFSELNQSTLNIHIKLNSITLSVTNNFSKKNIGFVHYPINNFLDADFIISRLKTLKDEEELLNYKYEHIKIILYDNPFIVIPEEVTADEYPDYFQMYHQINPETVSEDLTLKNKIKIVSAISSKASKQFTELFDNYTIKNYQSDFINYLLNIQGKSKSIVAYINILEEKADFIVINGNELLFINRFEYTSDEDILYYVLSVFEQLELNVETNFVYFLGQIELNDSLHELLKKYIRNIDTCPYKLQQELNNKITHQESYFLDVFINSN